MKKVINKFLIVLILLYLLFANNSIFATIDVAIVDNSTKNNILNNNSSISNNITTNLLSNTISTKTNVSSLNTPQVDSSLKVYDYANLLTKDEENTLYTQITNFINTHNMDMAVVTINKNNKSSAMAYADDFYDYNDFGKGSNKSGLLFLIDMDTREMWISTTGNAIQMYTEVTPYQRNEKKQ